MFQRYSHWKHLHLPIQIFFAQLKKGEEQILPFPGVEVISPGISFIRSYVKQNRAGAAIIKIINYQVIACCGSRKFKVKIRQVIEVKFSLDMLIQF